MNLMEKQTVPHESTGQSTYIKVRKTKIDLILASESERVQ